MEIQDLEKKAETVANKIYKKFEKVVFEQGNRMADKVTNNLDEAVIDAVNSMLDEIEIHEDSLPRDTYKELIEEITDHVTSELGVIFLNGFSESFYFPITVGE